MELSLNSNIQKYRKQMNLTQEQLAEAMGVTVGAVSKWECGLSNPDIQLIVGLADFFQISVDVLLGYDWNKKDVTQYAENIRKLCRERKFDEGMAEARKALQKYPNNFQIVYESLHIFMCAGMAKDNDRRMYETALELSKRALGLMEQNTDPKLSEADIHRTIGELYYFLGRTETALEYLIRHNYCGMNNLMIGSLYVSLERFKEAEEYTFEVFGKTLLELFASAQDVYNILMNTGHLNEAIELILWLRNTFEAAADEKRGYIRRLIIMMDTALAIAYCQDQAADGKPDMAAVRRRMGMAVKNAAEFDKAPDYRIGVRFIPLKEHSLNDDMGTALGGIYKLICTGVEQEDKRELLTDMYHELVGELGGNN